MSLSLFLASATMLAALVSLWSQVRNPEFSWRSRLALLPVAMLLIMVPKVLGSPEAIRFPSVVMALVIVASVLFGHGAPQSCARLEAGSDDRTGNRSMDFPGTRD